MTRRVDEVVKDNEGILRKKLEENLSKDTSTLEIPVQTKVPQDQPTVQIGLVEHVSLADASKIQVVDNSCDANQDPPKI